MSSADIKLDLFRMIDGVQDQASLKFLYSYIQQYLSASGKKAEIPAGLSEALDESIQQLERGEGIPHEEVMREFRSKYSA